MKLRTREQHRRRIARVLCPIALTLAAAALSAPAQAQPFGAWIILSSTTNGYIQVPSSPALNPSSAITIEAWVNVSTLGPTDCRSIVGKNYQQSWWVGICGTTLRSYLQGGASRRDGGTVPTTEWTHIAVTYDGVRRRHYINGELVATFPETGPLPASSSPLRIGSDVSFPFTPNGTIDEVRLWSVARSTAQIRSTINVALSSPMPGLVAVWAMNSAADALGAHNGTLVGSPGFLTFPAIFTCIPSSTFLCLNNHFAVSVKWKTPAPSSGIGHVVPCGSSNSGMFWFFDPSNWEMLIKVLNGCSINHHWWVFFAATTDVYYRLEVFDVRAGANKVYFNYQGEPAKAVTDTSAFATCP